MKAMIFYRSRENVEEESLWEQIGWHFELVGLDTEQEIKAEKAGIDVTDGPYSALPQAETAAHARAERINRVELYVLDLSY